MSAPVSTNSWVRILPESPLDFSFCRKSIKYRYVVVGQKGILDYKKYLFIYFSLLEEVSVMGSCHLDIIKPKIHDYKDQLLILWVGSCRFIDIIWVKYWMKSIIIGTSFDKVGVECDAFMIKNIAVQNKVYSFILLYALLDCPNQNKPSKDHFMTF